MSLGGWNGQRLLQGITGCIQKFNFVLLSCQLKRFNNTNTTLERSGSELSMGLLRNNVQSSDTATHVDFALH